MASQISQTSGVQRISCEAYYRSCVDFSHASNIIFIVYIRIPDKEGVEVATPIALPIHSRYYTKNQFKRCSFNYGTSLTMSLPIQDIEKIKLTLSQIKIINPNEKRLTFQPNITLQKPSDLTLQENYAFYIEQTNLKSVTIKIDSSPQKESPEKSELGSFQNFFYQISSPYFSKLLDKVKKNLNQKKDRWIYVDKLLLNEDLMRFLLTDLLDQLSESNKSELLSNFSSCLEKEATSPNKLQNIRILIQLLYKSISRLYWEEMTEKLLTEVCIGDVNMVKEIIGNLTDKFSTALYNFSVNARSSRTSPGNLRLFSPEEEKNLASHSVSNHSPQLVAFIFVVVLALTKIAENNKR